MLVRLRTLLQSWSSAVRVQYLRHVWGMDIGRGVKISRKAFLDFTHPKGIHIGEHTILTPGARVFSHEFVEAEHVDTYIGRKCFIGANALIMPGIRIGDQCIIAAGAVVTQDVPARSVVAGNPAKIIKSGVRTGNHGRTVIWAEGLE